MARARKPTRFDPYAILEALERERVTYILIGGLARVIEGSDELTRGVDLTPSTRPENLRRLEVALGSLDARPRDGRTLSLAGMDRTPLLALKSDHGEINVVPIPEALVGTTIFAVQLGVSRSAEASESQSRPRATSCGCCRPWAGNRTHSGSRRCSGSSSATAG